MVIEPRNHRHDGVGKKLGPGKRERGREGGRERYLFLEFQALLFRLCEALGKPFMYHVPPFPHWKWRR